MNSTVGAGRVGVKEVLNLKCQSQMYSSCERVMSVYNYRLRPEKVSVYDTPLAELYLDFCVRVVCVCVCVCVLNTTTTQR